MALASKMENILTLEENDDDELFLELPDELFEALGWDDGTILTWDIIGDSIRISKAPEETVGETLLPEQSRVVRTLEGVERGDGSLDGGDDSVVGEPSY
jgi:hypothetical protein